LPSALKSCRDKLGISSKIYSFSIPLGNTINMDGCCSMMLLTVLFFARAFTIELSPGLLFSMMISIYLLSVGSPGVPMGALVCVSMLMAQARIPKETLALVMGLYPVVAMVMTGTNVAGDGAVTLIVAHSEKMIDEKIFGS
ncbi:MAG: cation:dicarboxylase symporter family transporter, partial [Treponema sp.]|nr:cation:dicarboxylase symporter family transporter [Treponema sp.]